MKHLQNVFDFLTDLAHNNTSEWMKDNKASYLASKEIMIEGMSAILEKCADFDPRMAMVDPKKTLFRINRDIRFSKNKMPYKTNFGASITPQGKKTDVPGYYLHLMPNNSFIGGGLYAPSSENLRNIRNEIDYTGKELVRFITDTDFVQNFKQPYGEKLKKAPRGFQENHEHIELLKLKQYIFMKPIGQQIVCSEKFIDTVVHSFRMLHPIVLYLENALSD